MEEVVKCEGTLIRSYLVKLYLKITSITVFTLGVVALIVIYINAKNLGFTEEPRLILLALMLVLAMLFAVFQILKHLKTCRSFYGISFRLKEGVLFEEAEDQRLGKSVKLDLAFLVEGPNCFGYRSTAIVGQDDQIIIPNFINDYDQFIDKVRSIIK